MCYFYIVIINKFSYFFRENFVQKTINSIFFFFLDSCLLFIYTVITELKFFERFPILLMS